MPGHTVVECCCLATANQGCELLKSGLRSEGSCHWTPVGWTTKVGKAAGRYLFDARSKSAGTPLNSYTPVYLDSIRHEWGSLIFTYHSRSCEDDPEI